MPKRSCAPQRTGIEFSQSSSLGIRLLVVVFLMHGLDGLGGSIIGRQFPLADATGGG